jgi:hypothetical protein
VSFPTHLPAIAPASDIVTVSASDSADLTLGTCRALLVGTAGAATVLTANGTVATLIPLQAGYNPISVRRVYATGLTASNIWALY